MDIQPDQDAFLRELHHRVKNNFQMIASLINLQKRSLSPDRQPEIRFIEEHVQAMAVAYRIVTSADGVVQVPLNELVGEVVDCLRQIAGYNRNVVNIQLPPMALPIRIEQAIGIGLYLAVLIPPYLDAAAARKGVVSLALELCEPDSASLSLSGVVETGLQSDVLRQRLLAAYVRQLRAEPNPMTPATGPAQVRFRLQRAVAPTT